jgi:hypothetical protein
MFSIKLSVFLEITSYDKRLSIFIFDGLKLVITINLPALILKRDRGFSSLLATLQYRKDVYHMGFDILFIAEFALRGITFVENVLGRFDHQ